MFMVAPAMAGEDPYVAVVGNDILANTWYLSPKYVQFLYDQTITGIPTTGEGFRALDQINQPEICDINGIAGPDNGPPFNDLGETNAVVRKQNSGWFEWSIRLPKKPNAINICIQCGVLKPNTWRDLGYDAIQECAAYTGERIGTGFCTRNDVGPGQNPIIAAALPMITAIVYPGPFNAFKPFHLTAYRNPGTYNAIAQPMTDNQAIQLLDGPATTRSRVMLKSCFDKCINIKLPVTGQINVLGEVEQDLNYGDLIYVRMDIPDRNTVDVYCHAQSVKLMGIGEAIW